MSQSIEDESGPLDPVFDEQVLPAELQALAERGAAQTRRAGDEKGLPDFAAHLDTAELSPFLRDLFARLDDHEQHQCWRAWVQQAPERRHGGLTGLALSGGGVRSSTLNLGIVQVIHRLGLFKCLDYLSTVSGGGYFGSSISAGYAVDTAPDEDRLERTHRSFPYQHVRGRPEPTAFLQLRNFSCFLAPRGFIDYLRLPVLLLRGLLLNFLVFLPWILGLALLTRVLLVESAASTWLWRWHDGWPGPAYFGSTLWLTGALLALVVLFPMSRRIQIWTEGIGNTRVFRDLYERTMGVVAVLMVASAWVELQPLAITFFLHTNFSLAQLTLGAGGGSALLAMLGRLFARQLRSLASRFALYLIALGGFVAFWLVYLLASAWLIQAPGWWEGVLTGLPVAAAYVSLLIVLVPYSAWLIDANGLSLHDFYRDRLARAFLFRVKDGEVESSLDLKFSELSKHLGPLHLFNTTMNSRTFPQQFRKGRHGDPFFFSQVYSGSRTTGYCPTAQLEHAQPDLTVSTAIAASGAAVTSNMGVQTNPVLRVILSVLNIRLGYWLVNPYYYDSGERKLRYHPGRLLGVGVVRYLQELTGWLDYKRSYVYLSDGGHIENMGIYPLIHRQCRLIIVGDGECDPGYRFQGLLDAIRMIRVDFGVHIEMAGLDAIRSGAAQHALGTIHYPGGRRGYLVYLKSCLLGDDMVEATVPGQGYFTSPLRRDLRHYDSLGYIAHYRATHPTFPHEPTADQFFDEVQFECYRALGYLIAERAFRGAAEVRPRSVRQRDSMASELEGDEAAAEG
jgi:hypothetical protein